MRLQAAAAAAAAGHGSAARASGVGLQRSMRGPWPQKSICPQLGGRVGGPQQEPPDRLPPLGLPSEAAPSVCTHPTCTGRSRTAMGERAGRPQAVEARLSKAASHAGSQLLSHARWQLLELRGRAGSAPAASEHHWQRIAPRASPAHLLQTGLSRASPRCFGRSGAPLSVQVLSSVSPRLALAASRPLIARTVVLGVAVCRNGHGSRSRLHCYPRGTAGRPPLPRALRFISRAIPGSMCV